MTETEEQFLNRVYVGDNVLVYPIKRGIGKVQIWTIEQMKQYLDYLNGRVETSD